MLALAMAAYLSLYPALLLPPLILVAYDALPGSRKPSIYASTQTRNHCSILTLKQNFGSVMVLLFGAAAFGLLCLSFMITGRSWEFLRSTYGVHLLLPDLTPNVGLWWYFFIEMFDSFREFFLCVFQLHLVIYVGGLSIRLRKQPLFAITTLLGICSMFKSYPSIGDTTLYLGLLMLYRHVFPRKLQWTHRPECQLTMQSCATPSLPLPHSSIPHYSALHSTTSGFTPVPATPTSFTPLLSFGALRSLSYVRMRFTPCSGMSGRWNDQR